jgi:hypothetical protein
MYWLHSLNASPVQAARAWAMLNLASAVDTDEAATTANISAYAAIVAG